ncbi:MAG: DUF5654 family protein [Candidatus Aenigmatarchaeota archaeon]
MAKILEEIKKQMVVLITGALAFVAALIWKDAISAWLAPLYTDAEGAMGLTIAAIIVTVVVVIITVIIAKIFAPKSN